MTDIHSYSNPTESRVRHVELDLAVSFAEKKLRGAATLTLDQAGKTLVLDTRDLHILRVNGSSSGFMLGARDKFLGAPLTIPLAPGVRSVVVEYETAPEASGLQWLEPPQTAGKKHPFLFSQSQAIHARSWIPIQDSPGVRVTYSARIHAPVPLTPLMSARVVRPGHFHLPEPIPPYLIAIAVGDLQFQAIGQRCGVWAEPSVLKGAAWEFADMEKMVAAAESLYGPYRWGRYDLLVLPPSFPFGGMENPCLTFATPTVIAGDRSLVSLVSHELAHSWSGNLVTNATWSDFWLNEGFTTYIERRIQEALYGRRQSEMEFAIEVGELKDEMKDLPPADQHLAVDLKGRDPDDGMTQVPYGKGALLLRKLEEKYGREKFDAWIRSYFDHFAFQSITTDQFVAYLHQSFPNENLDAWIHHPGLPPDAPKISFDFETKPRKAWVTAEWLHWLRSLAEDLSAPKMADLDQQWDFTHAGNSEVAAQWLLMAVRAKYEPAYPRLQEFLVQVGRRKFVKPLFEALVKTPDGRARAQSIYQQARSGYHPITQATVDAILK
ncbi:M1 family metallopeptidase [Paludibaculum fermentans]|uniref:M1 family metallopeptidase n=1 Tax=Paludibaculum fermentans TaxID=1473598 RepID=UPI001E5219C4|nr:M1 family metallopeptidase [Paludibaculum fermentans]